MGDLRAPEVFPERLEVSGSRKILRFYVWGSVPFDVEIAPTLPPELDLSLLTRDPSGSSHSTTEPNALYKAELF
jgi:hypothetical protein